MKLKNIKIENLFGLEQNNFDIELYPNEKITILYGFNGVGKTSIIKLVSAILSCDLSKLFDIKFSRVIITFENDSFLDVTFKFDLAEKNRFLSFKIVDVDEDELVYTFNYKDYFFYNINLDSYQSLQKKLANKIDIHSVYANKDFNRMSDRKEIKIEYPTSRIMSLKKSMESFIKKYSGTNKPHPEFTFTVPYKDGLTELIKKISQDSWNGSFKLFDDIINNRMGLLYKKVRLVDSNDGFGICLEKVYANDPYVSLDMLSSGEKNVICLFLELIFLTSENSVFFIDEPETSLHVEWQKQLVPAIMEICNEYNYQAIIATHSPNVIDEYWGLMSPIRSSRYKDEKYFNS